jgi:hypothetical protein
MAVSNVTSTSDSRVFAITEFKTRNATSGSPVALTLAMLRARFETCERSYPAEGLKRKPNGSGWEKPSDLPLWSGATVSGARNRKNVSHLDLLVFEYDEECPAIVDVVEQWSRHEGFVHTSFNHAPDAPRLRVVLTLSRPVTTAEYDLLWQWGRDRSQSFGAMVDRSAKDPSRMWYVPAVVEGSEYLFERLTGAPVGVDALLEAMRAEEPAKPKMARLVSVASPRSDDNQASRLRGILDKAAERVRDTPDGARHESLMRETHSVAGYLGMRGAFSESELADTMLAAVLTSKNADRAKDSNSIRDAIASGRSKPRRELPPDTRGIPLATAVAAIKHKPSPVAIDDMPPHDEDGVLMPVAFELERFIEDVCKDNTIAFLAENLAHMASFGITSHEVQRILQSFRRGGGSVRDLRKKIQETEKILKAVANDTVPADGRTTIRVTSDIHTAVDIAITTLEGAPGLYSRGRSLVQVLRTKHDDVGPTIREMPMSIVRTLLSSRGVYVKHNPSTGMPSSVEVPDAVVAAVKDQGVWSTVPQLTGLLEAPSMRPDGSIIQEPGYDEATGFLYIPSEDFDPIFHSPSQEDAVEARKRFDEILSDFPFESDAGRSVFLASLLSVLARPAIKGSVPAFIFDANMSGSGKSLLVDLALLVATGRLASPIAYPGDDTELEKVLASYAMRAAQFINFDNITRGFGGGPLDKCLTAGGAIDLRVLGKSEALTFLWMTVIFASGNNVSIAGDTHRRALVCRLENMEEGRILRNDYKHRDIKQYVADNRGELVAAALTILRAWVVAGRPHMDCKPLGSFEGWSNLIPPALVFAGATNPLEALAAQKGVEDPWREALGVFLAGFDKLDRQGHGMTLKQMVARLYPEQAMGPDDLDDVREAIEASVISKGGKPDSGSLGRLLRGWKGVIRDGMKLEAHGAMGKVNRWYVTRVGSGRPGEGMRGSVEGQ